MLAKVVFQAAPLQILRNVRIIYYLRIYIGGFAFLFLYNVAIGIFTSLGDSKTPLYFLIGSSLGNIFLDYWFVAGLHWGVAGVAWATFIAQNIGAGKVDRVKQGMRGGVGMGLLLEVWLECGKHTVIMVQPQSNESS